MPIHFRPALASDAPAIAQVYLTSRKHFLPYAPLAHNDETVRNWIADHLLPHTRVIVAVLHGDIVGMLALAHAESCGWIDQLYLLPDYVGHGIGSQYVDLAKAASGSPLRLFTFQANQAARRFYERHAFKAIDFSEGSRN